MTDGGLFNLVTVLDEPGTHFFKHGLGDESLPTVIYQEFSFMVSLPTSPYLIRPTAAVIDAFGFRGFLLPYHPAGSLNIVFSDHMNVVLNGRDHPERSSTEVLRFPHATISWTLKELWALDIVKALHWLHEQDVWWGDLRLENIILCLDGCCRFIDYHPSGCCNNSAPPEFFISHQITGPQDIFSLGLVLWCVAHEIGSFTRNPEEAPALIWAPGTPLWYQEIVELCVREDPAERPDVNTVYNIFCNYTQ